MSQPLSPSPPPSPPRPAVGRAAAAVVALLCFLGSVASPVALPVAAADPGATTTSTTTPTTAFAPAPGGAATSTTTPVPANTTTVPAPTTTSVPPQTTTTAPASSWTVQVPGPPPPQAVPATPADIARANQLERQIVTQANVLDVLAEQYNQAQQKVAATATQLDEVRARLATARADADAAHARVVQAGQTARDVAVAAYVNLGSGALTSPSALLATYERGTAQTDADTAIGKALGLVRELHQAERELRASETAIVNEEQQASDANGVAQAAAAQAQAAARAATSQQQQLLNVVSQVSGNLVQLVAAAHEAEAQAAFNRFRTGGGLDFQPTVALASPSVQAGAAVQAAMAQVGKPYVWGAAGPDSFDCSGLVLWSWARAGGALPRVAADQQAWATPVPISQLAPGDLVFFGNPAHHVGMYVGGGLMVDAPHTGDAVSVVPIWWDDLAGFGRVHQP